MITKTILVNGVAVGEYEATDDLEADLETAANYCTTQMRAQAAVPAPDCPPVMITGHSACTVGTDIAARKAFSRACMASQGWTLQ